MKIRSVRAESFHANRQTGTERSQRESNQRPGVYSITLIKLDPQKCSIRSIRTDRHADR